MKNLSGLCRINVVGKLTATSVAYRYSQAFVNLANALDVDIPKSIQDHANHHKSAS